MPFSRRLALVVFVCVFGASVVGCSRPAASGPGPRDPSPHVQAPTEVTQVCVVSDVRLDEVSGMAASVAHPGLLWLHNDSSDATRIFGLDAQTCAVRAVIDVTGFESVDMEAIALGQDKDGQWVLWLGDIGDNIDAHSHVTIAKIPEPTTIADQVIQATPYQVTYSDGPRNAEALLVQPGPEGDMWIVTKSEGNDAQYYRVPIGSGARDLVASPVGAAPTLVTDAAYAPDGRTYVLRTYFDGKQFDGLPPGSAARSLGIGFHGQGEAITYSFDSAFLYFMSEGESPPLLAGPLP